MAAKEYLACDKCHVQRPRMEFSERGQSRDRWCVYCRDEQFRRNNGPITPRRSALPRVTREQAKTMRCSWKNPQADRPCGGPTYIDRYPGVIADDVRCMTCGSTVAEIMGVAEERWLLYKRWS